MLRKRCSRCRKLSYSLSAKGRWICPDCGEDLTDVPVMVPDRSTADVIPVQCADPDPPSLN